MRLLSQEELKVVKGVNYSRWHLLRLEKLGKFPRRVMLGGRRSAWPESEIDAWIAGQIAARDAAA